jgi:acetyl-CoA carboxylase biotin carboxyl carrier protein
MPIRYWHLGKVENRMSEKNNKSVPPEGTVMSGKIDYDEIRRLVGLLEEKNLSVFELEIEGLKVKIARSLPPAAPVAAAPAAPPAEAPRMPEAPSPAQAAGPGPELQQGHHLITSPMVGTFYRAPDPTSAPFVDIGDSVKKGQTLCIIEAMKLMNEIEADVDGTISEVYVDNAKPVEYGQKLFAILPQS